MKYNIISIPDIHWGAIDPYVHEDQLQFILEFMDECSLQNIDIDLIVIAGDYWDTKMSLDSAPVIIAIKWFGKLIQKAKSIGVKAFRLFEGTRDHDNDQLEVFRPYEKQFPEWFKLFTKTTSEETLPNFQCIYCPDETLTNIDYMENYLDAILNDNSIGFFHGSFDVVLGDILVQNSERMNIKNVIYKYGYWERMINGPMISGHWHDGKAYNHLYYSGSPTRWAFNENEDKGFSFIQYDTNTNNYFYKKITNPISPLYKTYEVYTNLYNSIDNYNKLIDNIDKDLKNDTDNQFVSLKLRILIYVVDDKTDNDTFIVSLRHYYINDKRVTFTIKNKLKDKKKKEIKKIQKENKEKFNFIDPSKLTTAEIIQQYVLVTKGVKVPLDLIKEKINKYSKDVK